MLADLMRDWDLLWESQRHLRTAHMVKAGCSEVAPYLVMQLRSADPYYRDDALVGLSKLRRKEYRPQFIEAHLHDPDAMVRKTALLELCELFRGEADEEILGLALLAYDDLANPLSMRLTAGAVMMYQLGVPHDEDGRPAWWHEDEPDELDHPSIQRAVAETRRRLAPPP